jgi:hypothetical protein
VDVGILPNHVNYLCTYVIGVCFLVLSFKLIFRIKDWWEIGCQLNYQFSQQKVYMVVGLWMKENTWFFNQVLKDVTGFTLRQRRELGDTLGN